MNKYDKLRSLLLQWADKYYLPLKKEFDECDKERLRYRDMAQRLYLENKELKHELLKMRYSAVKKG